MFHLLAKSSQETFENLDEQIKKRSFYRALILNLFYFFKDCANFYKDFFYARYFYENSR